MNSSSIRQLFFPVTFLIPHFLLLFLFACAEIACPLLVMKAIDIIVLAAEHNSNSFPAIAKLAVLLLSIILVQFGLRFLMAQRLGEHIFHAAHSLRLRLLEQTIRSLGPLVSEKRISNCIFNLHRDINDLQESLIQLLSELPYDILTIIGVTFAAFIINPYFGVGFFLMTSFFAVFLYFFSIRGSWLYTQVTGANEILMNSLNENVRSAVHGTKIELHGESVHEIEESSIKLTEAHLDRQKFQAILAPFFGLSEYLGIVMVLLLGGLAASKGQISAGALVAYFAFVEIVAEPLHRIGIWQSSLHRFMVSWRGIAERTGSLFIGGEKLIPEIITTLAIQDGVVSQVDTSATLLKCINFTIPIGSTVALIGRNGSGKTSLLEAIVGFNPFSHGGICINGAPFSEYLLSSWQKKIGTWPQEVYLLERSLEQNITLESSTQSAARLLEAITVAGLLPIIQREPEGVKALCGPDGIRLSGGEKQRLAFARLIYREPKIVLLDEPTSAIDLLSEMELVPRIADFLKGRTCILVSHRPELLVLSSHVVVLDNGIASTLYEPYDAWNELPQFRELFPRIWSLSEQQAISI